MRKRLSPDTFRIPVDEIKSGLYTDCYFLRTREILLKENRPSRVLMQVFQRQQAVVCGIDEAIAIIRLCAYNPDKLVIKALYDGDAVQPWETVMTIEGDLADFASLETLYLGVLSRQTKIATNVRRCVDAAAGKPVLFFAARFDPWATQLSDGYAAHIGGIYGVSTPANGLYWGSPALGTIPHALIATYGGDTTAATLAFDRHIDPSVNRVALVDYDNDCVGTSLAVARAMGDRLWAVRLDTGDNMVDVSVVPQMGNFRPLGVCGQLVRNVRQALDAEGFGHIKIMVSGGFTAKRIAEFEAEKVPADIYAVGSSLFNDNINFTADIVMVDGKPAAKAGRSYSPNPRLVEA